MRITKEITVDFPDWAISYFIYGDASGIDAEEAEMVDAWWESMIKEGYTNVSFTDERDEFTPYPEFGLACETVRANVVRLS